MASKKKKAVLFACGAIPGLEAVRDYKNIQTYSLLPGCSLDTERLQLLDELKKTSKGVAEFKSKFLPWVDERRNVIKTIKELAENIEWHHRNINVSKIPTFIAGIGGGILTIVGLALLPVTLGASLGLTIAGASVGVTAAVTGGITSATDVGININRRKKAESLVQSHNESTNELVAILDALLNTSEKIETLATPEVMNSFKEMRLRNMGHLSQTSVSGLISTASVVKSLAMTIPDAGIAVTRLRNGLTIAAAAGITSYRSFEVATDAAGGAVRVVATTTGKVFAGFGFAFSAIGIVVDVVSLAATTYDLATGSKTSVSKQLKKHAIQLEKELGVMKTIKSKLDECDAQ